MARHRVLERFNHRGDFSGSADARRASLALAEERLADTVLSAPAVGIVRDRLLEPGDLATPQSPVLTLCGCAPGCQNPTWEKSHPA